MIANYVAMLSRAMEQYAECTSTDDTSQLHQLYEDFKPDVLHIHAHPSFKLSSDSLRLVITPHGTPPTTLMKKAYVCIARSNLEANRLAHAEICRIEILRNPIFTKTISFESLAQRMAVIYQKVMDSNVLPLMDDDSRLMLSVLLKTGLCGDRRWTEDSVIPQSTRWRQLFIYAESEGVMPIIERGIRLLGINVPPYSPADCYLPKPPTTHLQQKDRYNIVTLMKQLRAQSDTGRLSLSLLCLLHQALYKSETNENLLLEELKQQKLKPLFCSTLQILKEQLLLDEGFMPCSPSDDRTTKQLRHNLYRNLQL